MIGRARSVVMVAGLAVGLVACNLIAGLTEEYGVAPLDGSAANGNDGSEDGAIDGSMPGSDAPPGPDAQNDSSKPTQYCSGITATDAGADAGVVVFCEDFEDVDASPFGFTTTSTANTTDASFSVESNAGYMGASAGLRVVTLKGVPSAAVWVQQLLVLDDPNRHQAYEAQLDFMDEASPISYTALGILTFDDGTSSVREHGFGTFANGAQLSKLSPASDSVADNQRWHHAVILLNRPAPGMPFDRYLRIDNEAISIGSPMSLITSGGVELRLGTFNTGSGTGTLKARFDNVVVREW